MTVNESTKPAPSRQGAPPHPHEGKVTNTAAKPSKLVQTMSGATINLCGFLREPLVTDITGLKRTTLRVKVKDGSFPAPVRLSSRAVGWRATDVMAWVDSRKTVGGN